MITRPITRPVTSPIARAVTAAYGAWNPRALFAPGEQGVIYDPNDLSTLFQDAAGTTPVTAAGQPVGLTLDKRLGLVRGPELAPTSGNSVNFSAAAQNTVIDVAPAGVIPSSGFVEVTFTISNYVAGSVRVIVYGTGSNAVAGSSGVSGNGVYTFRVAMAVGGSANQTIRVQAYAVAPNTCTVTVNSVRELPGNHRFQTAAASRPMLRDTPRRIDYDAVDDALNASFPASLGSACTVARSIPGTGAQILTAQTIGTSFTDNVDNSGLIIINRALNPTETANLTRYLNQRAGV